MTSIQPQQLTASSARVIFWALVGGLISMMVVFASLFWMGTAPLLRDDPRNSQIIASVIAVAGLGSLAIGWVWARPNVPLRPPGKDAAAFWNDPNAGAKALLLWVLFEGGTVMATVGSFLTGSVLTESVAAIGLALMVTHSPGYLEHRAT